MTPIFITGIGTDVGKTVVSAIITEALHADYWKPVQAGKPTDSDWMRSVISNNKTVIHKEAYNLDLPASPHISSKNEGIVISLQYIKDNLPDTNNLLIIEGAGGLFVPLNDDEFIIDLIKMLNAKVIVVSSNYLGSINHSLLTASVLNQNKIEVLGWIFNDEYMDYENDITKWSNLPSIASIKKLKVINKEVIKNQADIIEPLLKKLL